MSDRLLATSWRFEQNKGNTNTKRLQQEAQIALKEEEAALIHQIQREQQELNKIHWHNDYLNFNELSKRKLFVKKEAEDLRILRKANILVRRAALKNLLIDDQKSYIQQLGQKGLTLHKERI